VVVVDVLQVQEEQVVQAVVEMVLNIQQGVQLMELLIQAVEVVVVLMLDTLLVQVVQA
jgi:hypothetical protein